MTASTRVLSEAFAEKIGGRRVLAALFTTFTFDPAFFELEILPLLFEGRISGGFSPNEKMRRVQLEECLREVAGIDVFYDRGGLVANAQSATLDFRRIDVSRPSGVFHPKLVFVLLENPPTEGDETTKSLIAGALSAISPAPAGGRTWRPDTLRRSSRHTSTTGDARSARICSTPST